MRWLIGISTGNRSLPRVSMSPNPHAADPTAKLRPPPTVSPLAAGINSVKGHETSTLTRGQKFVTRPQTPVKPQAPPPDGDTLRRPGVSARPPTLTPTDDNHVTSSWHASLPRRPAPVHQHRTAQVGLFWFWIWRAFRWLAAAFRCFVQIYWLVEVHSGGWSFSTSVNVSRNEAVEFFRILKKINISS